jgi:hypothetical protein
LSKADGQELPFLPFHSIPIYNPPIQMSVGRQNVGGIKKAGERKEVEKRLKCGVSEKTIAVHSSCKPFFAFNLISSKLFQF